MTTVAAILSEKGSQVSTIAPGETLGDAAGLLHSKGIGALIVLGEGEGVSGIISERDVVAAVAKNGAQALAEPVSRHMAARVISCRPADPIIRLMSIMTRRRFRHLPVVEDGKLCGIISIGDVVKWRIEQTEKEAEALRGYIASG